MLLSVAYHHYSNGMRHSTFLFTTGRVFSKSERHQIAMGGSTQKFTFFMRVYDTFIGGIASFKGNLHLIT